MWGVASILESTDRTVWLFKSVALAARAACNIWPGRGSNIASAFLLNTLRSRWPLELFFVPIFAPSHRLNLRLACACFNLHYIHCLCSPALRILRYATPVPRPISGDTTTNVTSRASPTPPVNRLPRSLLGGLSAIICSVCLFIPVTDPCALSVMRFSPFALLAGAVALASAETLSEKEEISKKDTTTSDGLAVPALLELTPTNWQTELKKSKFIMIKHFRYVETTGPSWTPADMD